MLQKPLLRQKRHLKKDAKVVGKLQSVRPINFCAGCQPHIVCLYALMESTDALASVRTCSHALLATQVQQAKYNPGALSGQLAQACPSCAQGPAM